MTIKAPFLSIRQWMQRHHESLSSFTANFIATVLGIVLTFGTSMWYENRQKRAEAEDLVERCLSNMEGRMASLEKVIDFYDQHDKLLNLVNTVPWDSLQNNEVEMLLDVYIREMRLITNHSYEKSFSISANSHEILGSYANVIGEGYEYLLRAEQVHDEINDMKRELKREQVLSRNTYWDKHSFEAVVATALSDPHFAYFQDEFTQRQMSVRHIVYFMQTFLPEARRLWNKEISEQEFRDNTRQRWEEWH